MSPEPGRNWERTPANFQGIFSRSASQVPSIQRCRNGRSRKGIGYTSSNRGVMPGKRLTLPSQCQPGMSDHSATNTAAPLSSPIQWSQHEHLC